MVNFLIFLSFTLFSIFFSSSWGRRVMKANGTRPNCFKKILSEGWNWIRFVLVFTAAASWWWWWAIYSVYGVESLKCTEFCLWKRIIIITIILLPSFFIISSRRRIIFLRGLFIFLHNFHLGHSLTYFTLLHCERAEVGVSVSSW